MSIGTITTKSWCAVKDGKAYEGSRADIVGETCRVRVCAKPAGGWIVHYWFNGPYESDILEYSPLWNDPEELRRDINRSLFSKLPNYGYRLYRDVG